MKIAAKYVLIAYTSFVAIWFIVNRLAQDSWWGWVVLDKFAEYFLWPSIAVFLLACFSRKNVTVAFALPPLLICLYFYLPFFFTITVPEHAHNGSELRVGTFNIWNHNENLDAAVDVIQHAEVDVVALQEITEEKREKLAQMLRSTHPYYHISKDVFGGTTALFSRLQLTDVKEIDVNVDRPAIVADIYWNKKKITILSAHLNPSFWAYWRQPWRKVPGNYLRYIQDQRVQAQAIVDTLGTRNDSAATVLACDCNSQETASTNRLLRRYFQDAFRSLGWQLGAGAPAGMKFERKLSHIDYIWYAGSIKPNALYRSTRVTGSDHDLLIAEFVLDTSIQ